MSKETVNLAGHQVAVEKIKQYLYAYTVKDNKSQRYDVPFWCLNEINAKRKFHMDIAKEGTVLNSFPNDFSLHKIATFEIISGHIVTHDPEKNVIMTGETAQKNIESEA